MDPLTAPGLLPLELGALPPPDPTAEPAGFVVASDDGNRIHFLDWGPDPGARSAGAQMAGEAPAASEPLGVLLLPGLASTAWSWAAVARRLAASARVVAMDLRGHGLSDSPTEGYESEVLAGDVLAVADGAAVAVLVDVAA